MMIYLDNFKDYLVTLNSVKSKLLIQKLFVLLLKILMDNQQG
jgi:hypothetical protein